MLQARGLSFAHAGHAPLFAGLDLDVAPGEVVGVSGPSGAGKTTLARVLAGHRRPTAGNVTVDGYAPRPGTPHPVQLVGQHPELAVNPRWRIRRVLAEGPATPEHTRALCEVFGIEESWQERYPAELSGGQLARVVCVRALAPTTHYLITDEATAMHDPLTQAELWRALVRVAADRELGLVVISHDEHLLGHLCHRVLPIAPHHA